MSNSRKVVLNDTIKEKIKTIWSPAEILQIEKKLTDQTKIDPATVVELIEKAIKLVPFSKIYNLLLSETDEKKLTSLLGLSSQDFQSYINQQRYDISSKRFKIGFEQSGLYSAIRKVDEKVKLRVVSLACGHAEEAHYLLQAHPNMEYIGVDIEKEMLSLAPGYYQKMHKKPMPDNITFDNQDAQLICEPKSDSEKFDIIILRNPILSNAIVGPTFINIIFNVVPKLVKESGTMIYLTAFHRNELLCAMNLLGVPLPDKDIFQEDIIPQTDAMVICIKVIAKNKKLTPVFQKIYQENTLTEPLKQLPTEEKVITSASSAATLFAGAIAKTASSHKELCDAAASLCKEIKGYNDVLDAINQEKYSKALRMVCVKAQPIFVSLILKYRNELNIDVHEKNSQGKTAFDYAEQITDSAKKISILRLLNKNSLTPLSPKS